MFTCEPAKSSAQCQSRNTGDRDITAGGREPMRLQSIGDFSPRGSCLDAHRVRGSIDCDVLHKGKVDYKSLIANREAGNVVAGAAYREQETPLAREVDHEHHVLGARALGNQAGSSVDHRVKDFARYVIPLIIGVQQLSAKS